MLLWARFDRGRNSEREVVRDIRRRSFLSGAAASLVAPRAFAAAAPARVVTLEWTATEIALSLGVSPVGCAEIAGYKQWVNVAADGLVNAVDVGRRQQPNLEAIRKLQPDLILSSRYRHATIAEALGAIAPVHLIDDQSNTGDMLASVYDSTRQAGEALSLSSEAAALLTRFDDDVQALKFEDASNVSMRKVVVAQPLPGVPRLRIFAPNAAICGILKRIGFSEAMEMPPQPFGFTTIDIEGLAALDAETTLVVLSQALPQELTASSLWPLLPIVTSGHVLHTGPQSWPFGSSVSLIRLTRDIVGKFS